MPNQTATPFTLEATAGILIRCFWIGTAIMVLWFVAFLAGGKLGYEFHQNLWSGLTRHEFDLFNLYGMSILKFVVLTFFLVPYLSIRLVLMGPPTAP